MNCDLLMCAMFKQSFIPPTDVRQFRDLVRYKEKLTNCPTREKDCAQNCMTVSNLKLDDMFSDVFGKSASSITEYITVHPGEYFDVTAFVPGWYKQSIEEIHATVDGTIAREQEINLR